MAQESKNENRKQRIREAFHDGKQVERMPAERTWLLSIPTMLSIGLLRTADQYDVRNAGREF